MRYMLLAVLFLAGCATTWQHPDGRRVECEASIKGFDVLGMLGMQRQAICEDAAQIAGFQRVK